MTRAYTLVETLLALVVVALIGVAAAAILQTTAYGTSAQRDTRRLVVRGEAVHTRLDTAIRNARAVLAAGSGYIVLWTGDTNADGHVNLSELELIEVPSGSTTMTDYVGQYAAGDTVYTTSTNFYNVVQALKQGGANPNFPPTTWATGISGLTFTLDNSTPMLAKLATWSLTLTDQQATRTIISGATLGVWAQPR